MRDDMGISAIIRPRWSRPAATFVSTAASLLAMFLGAPTAAGAESPAHGMVPPAGERDGPAEVGTGSLLWGRPGSRQALPILEFHVEIEISGFLVHGTVNQVFQNPTSATLEALYVFPLPESAAVKRLEMRIGERRIVAEIQEKEAARRTYEAARGEGRKAALLEQDRPNLFTIVVSGVNPGEKVAVHLEYIEELAYDRGAFELVFPLTHTERYGPSPGPEAETRMNPGPAGSTAVAAPPRSSLTVRLDAGLPLQDFTSDSHVISSRWENEILIIEPQPGTPFAADRDFHLRFVPLVGHEPEAVLLVEDRDEARYVLVMVLPPQQNPETTGLATETLFVVDISGSMAGPSIRQARAALLAAVRRLHPGDAFNILAFNDSVLLFADDYVAAGDEAQDAADEWIQGLTAGGGTGMALALESAFELVNRHESWRVERMVFLTDGAVSTEDVVLEQIHSRLGKVRLHTLGIGSAPNRYLMRQMAATGKGLSAFISRQDQAANDIDLFLARLARPVMTDIELIWAGDSPLETYPDSLPDLHDGEPLILSVRFAPGAIPGHLIMKGRIAGGSIRRTLDFGAGLGQGVGIATLWARHKVVDLEDSLHRGALPDVVRQDVISVSRRFGIVTRYTSLVAVEAFPTAQGENRHIRVASTLPGRGQLPLGGTVEPLMRLIMIVSAFMAAVAVLAGHALRRFHRGDTP